MLRDALESKINDQSCEDKTIPPEKLIYTVNNNFKDSIIGEGYSADVASATLNGEKVAVKLTKVSEILESVDEASDQLLNEAKMMRAAQHPQIAKYIGMTYLDSKPGIVMKLYAETLRDRLLDSKKSITLEQSLKWAKQIAEAIAYMHSQNLYHTDLNTTNIFLDEDDNAILADLGETHPFEASKIRTNRGTSYFPYAYKKAFEDGTLFNFTGAHEIYMFGLLLLAMVTRKDPFSLDDPTKEYTIYQIWQLKKEGKETSFIPNNCPEIFKEMISACLAHRFRCSTFKKIVNLLQTALLSLQKPTQLDAEHSRLFQSAPPSAPQTEVAQKKIDLGR